jgi:hypothetical protein
MEFFKKISSKFLLYLNGIKYENMIVIKVVNIFKFAINSSMYDYILSISPNSEESTIIETKLSKSIKKVSTDYMDWEYDDDKDIIKNLQKLEVKKRTAFWILLAAELNIDSNKKELEEAIVETQKAYIFLKKNRDI